MISPNHLLGHLQAEQAIARRRRHLRLVEPFERSRPDEQDLSTTPDAA